MTTFRINFDDENRTASAVEVEEDEHRVASPPEYQKQHKQIDAGQNIAHHYPQENQCQCGASTPTHQDWANHLARVLFPI